MHMSPGVTIQSGRPPVSPPSPTLPANEGGPLSNAAGALATETAGKQDARLSTFSLSSWAIARWTLIVGLVLGALSQLWRIQEVLTLLLLAILFATAIEPLVDRLRRGPFSRGQGILVVYTALFGLIVALGVTFLPGLVSQGTTFTETLPQQIASLRPLAETVGPRPLREALVQAISAAAPAVQRTLQSPAVAAEPAQLVAAGGALLHTLFSVVTVFLLAYYWLTERATLKRAVLRMAPPARARKINATWLHVEARLGGWVRGQLLVMIALGIMSGVTFVALGLPDPLLLAVLAALCEIIPLIGPFLAFIPALLVALTMDPAKALLLVPIAIVIQQIEGNVLIPRVMSHTVGVSPLTVILGILLGATLYGAAGAFLAVPVAAAIQVILNDALRPSTVDEIGQELSDG